MTESAPVAGRRRVLMGGAVGLASFALPSAAAAASGGPFGLSSDGSITATNSAPDVTGATMQRWWTLGDLPASAGGYPAAGSDDGTSGAPTGTFSIGNGMSITSVTTGPSGYALYRIVNDAALDLGTAPYLQVTITPPAGWRIDVAALIVVRAYMDRAATITAAGSLDGFASGTVLRSWTHPRSFVRAVVNLAGVPELAPTDTLSVRLAFSEGRIGGDDFLLANTTAPSTMDGVDAVLDAYPGDAAVDASTAPDDSDMPLIGFIGTRTAIV